MSNSVSRPEADKKKIHTKNEFELCYLRHQYIRKTTHNPTPEEMAPYKLIANKFAQKTFYTYINLFHLVGFNREDVENIAQVHLVSFLGLFTLEQSKERMAKFDELIRLKHGRMPTETEILNKNKASYTDFIKQRMTDLVRVSKQKARNIKGFQTEDYATYVGDTKPPKLLADLMRDHEAFGYRKVDPAVFKSIKKKAGAKTMRQFKFDGRYYVSIKFSHKNLDVSDFAGADLDPYDNIHYMNPEQVFFNRDDQDIWEQRQEEFRSKSKGHKVKTIKNFILTNRNNPKFKEEVKIAEDTLRKMGIQWISA